MQPISKSELMIQVQEMQLELDAWHDAALESMAREVLLTAAIQKHRDAKKIDAWGYITLDANEELYATLDKAEAGVLSPALGAGGQLEPAMPASNGGPDVRTWNIFGVEIPCRYGGSD